MSYVLVPQEWLNTLKQDIVAEIRDHLCSHQPSISKHVKTREAMIMLQCSETKLDNLRKSSKLPFTQVGRTYYYKTQDTEKLLNTGY